MSGSPTPAAVVVAARSCLRTRFHMTGRVPGVGLDCAGLVVWSLLEAGYGDHDRPEYLIGGYGGGRALWATFHEHLASIGDGAPVPGSLLLLETSPGWVKSAIATPAGVIHADLGRGVIEHRMPPTWRVRLWGLPKALTESNGPENTDQTPQGARPQAEALSLVVTQEE